MTDWLMAQDDVIAATAINIHGFVFIDLSPVVSITLLDRVFSVGIVPNRQNQNPVENRATRTSKSGSELRVNPLKQTRFEKPSTQTS